MVGLVINIFLIAIISSSLTAGIFFNPFKIDKKCKVIINQEKIIPSCEVLDSVVIVKHPLGGWGSGFFISADGYLITNAHIAKKFMNSSMRGVVTIETRDHKAYRGKIIKIDHNEDLALIKINDIKTFSYLDLDKEIILKGERLLVLGYSHRELTGRDINHIYFSNKYLWEGVGTPGIWHGDSGGPIINKDEEVVGVGSAYLPKTRHTLYVPVKDVRNFIKGIK